MTEEHIDLLTKDLCGRLPYKVKIKTDFFQTATLISLRKNISLYSGKELVVTFDISGKDEPYQTDERWGHTISDIKPYLFPPSSMTKEQLELFDGTILPNGHVVASDLGFDYLDSIHVDYRGLIPLGLALDATNLKIY